MSLVVSLGLGRLSREQGHRVVAEAVLRALVAEGLTTRVREILASRDELLAEAPVEILEAVRSGNDVIVRALDAIDATSLLADVRTLHHRAAPASFSWAQLEARGAFAIPTLAVALDGAQRAKVRNARVELPFLGAVGVGDLRESSAMNWRGTRGQTGQAQRTHTVAWQHRLIVHCA